MCCIADSFQMLYLIFFVLIFFVLVFFVLVFLFGSIVVACPGSPWRGRSR